MTLTMGEDAFLDLIDDNNFDKIPDSIFDEFDNGKGEEDE